MKKIIAWGIFYFSTRKWCVIRLKSPTGKMYMIFPRMVITVVTAQQTGFLGSRMKNFNYIKERNQSDTKDMQYL